MKNSTMTLRMLLQRRESVRRVRVDGVSGCSAV